ncbi:hypothetical protein [uncultured Brachyspira sp.]|uniref:hypothetical protein n=1 Tax=uncultured Brachyspira sp. TaxID=221953 RepID=UPI002633B940|nr:hypothetical protein [uncultured Brachyspira sp.]
MSKRNIILFIILTALSLCACQPKSETVMLTDIAIDMPKDFQRGFLDKTVAVDNTVEFNESYGVERKTAIYTIVYTKYKSAYSGMISLENAKNKIINGLKNHYAIKEFQVISEGTPENSKNSYQVLSSFYYGPNKTYHKSFLMLHDNGILQIMCMYNANSKKDDKQINDIIQSVRIMKDNTANTNN